MTTHRTVDLSDHERAVAQYYDDATGGFYVRGWNPDHIHFGLYEPGECPKPGEILSKSPGVARAVERMIDVIVAPAGIRANHSVVDAGCGIGGTAVHLAQKHGCTVSGVNISRVQLNVDGAAPHTLQGVAGRMLRTRPLLRRETNGHLSEVATTRSSAPTSCAWCVQGHMPNSVSN